MGSADTGPTRACCPSPWVAGCLAQFKEALLALGRFGCVLTSVGGKECHSYLGNYG